MMNFLFLSKIYLLKYYIFKIMLLRIKTILLRFYSISILLNFILNINLKSTSTGSLIFVMERTSFRSRVRNRCFQRQPVSEQFVDT